MTEQEVNALNPTLGGFLDQFQFCCAYSQTFEHLGRYVRGLLSDLKSKNAEAIAVLAGIPPRTLQQFLRDHVWDQSQVRANLQTHVADLLRTLPDEDGLGTVGVIDETSDVKDGRYTPGVKRQYLGCVGKIDNGIVTVHTGVARGSFKTLLDADLFLPEDWSDDRDRCRAAGIPNSIVHRPKWQIALEQLDRLKSNSVSFAWLTFDEGYGMSPEFLFGLDRRVLPFVGEVPKSFSCMAVHRNGKGPAEGVKGRHAEDVVRTTSAFCGQPWQVLKLKRQTRADQVWRVKAARVWLSSSAGWSVDSYWLIWACNDETGEEKFFLSNAPVEATVEVMVRVAFMRWNVEHSFRLCKKDIGLADYEGRNYVGLQRHLTLTLVAMTFVAEHTQRLRGKKSAGNNGADLPVLARDLPPVLAGPTGEVGTVLSDGTRFVL